MNGGTPESWSDLWQRRMLPLVTVVPYVLLAVLVAVTIGLKHSTAGSLVIDLALCGGAAAWMLWNITLHPAWRQRPRMMAVFLAVFVVIMMVLVIRNPWFGFFTPAGYFYAFHLLPWPSELVGVGAVAVVAGTAQASGIDKTTPLGVALYIAILAANLLPMCGLAWFGWHNDQHDDELDRTLMELTEANRRLEATLAENAGLHEQLMDQAREAGVLDERQRMAREIHDTLAQGLIGIITQLQAVEHAGEDPARWERHLTAAIGLARESLSEARRSVHELRPEQLETARLADALGGVAERWSELHGIPVHVLTNGVARPMQADIEVALLRAAQESLANVAKHARATRVEMTLSYVDDEIALNVRDDGCGFAENGGRPMPRVGAQRPRVDPLVEPGTVVTSEIDGYGEPPQTSVDGPGGGWGGGFGLVAMRQRIEGMSGTLRVESEPGAGTAISIRIPVAAEVCA